MALRNVRAIGLIVAVGLVAGCGQDDSPKASSASKPIGPEGGSVELPEYHVRLDIPQGALEETIAIGIEASSSGPSQEELSRAFVMTPDGTEFLAGVELQIGIEKSESPERIVVISDSGFDQGKVPLSAELSSEDGARVARTTIHHFSNFGVRGFEREHSFCSIPLDGLPDPFCTKEGRGTHIAWGIFEHGLIGRQPDAWFLFHNLTTELIIPEYFEVTNGVNLPDSRVFFGEGLDSYTTGDAILLPPTNYGKPSWRQQVAASSEPRKQFWRWYGRGPWVFPEEDTKTASFDWCLGYRLADGQSEPPLCGHYEGAKLSTSAVSCTAWGTANDCAASLNVRRVDRDMSCTHAVVPEGTNSCAYDVRFLACLEGHDDDDAGALGWRCYLMVASDGRGDPVPANAAFTAQGIPHTCMGTGAYKIWGIPADQLMQDDCSGLHPKADGTNAWCNSGGTGSQCGDFPPIEP